MIAPRQLRDNVDHAGYADDEVYVDDDEYLEYTVSWDELEPSSPEPGIPVDEDDWVDTEPLALRTVTSAARAGTGTWRGAAVESWRRPLDEPTPDEPAPEPPRENGTAFSTS